MFGWFIGKPKFKENDILIRIDLEEWQQKELILIRRVGKNYYNLVKLNNYYKDDYPIMFIDDNYKKYEGSLERIEWDKAK